VTPLGWTWFGVVLGMLVTPIVALWALSEAEPAEP
jgi:hypothetical protein